MALTTYHSASDDALLNEPFAWYLKATNVFHAWKYTTGYHSLVKVGIWDTGVMPHTDLGLPDGASQFPGDNDYTQHQTSDSHGTTIWAAIKAKRSNGEGVAGVAPDARVAFFTDQGNGGDATAFAAILDAAVTSGVRIISYSAGPNVYPTGISGRTPVSSDPSTYPGFAEAQAAMGRFVAAGGLLVLAANDADWMEPRDAINVYAHLDRAHALAVSGYSAEENNYLGLGYTSWGPDIDLVAPAFNTPSAIVPRIGTGTGYSTGSWAASGATPIVAGVAAMVWSIEQSLSVLDVKEILKSTSRKTSHLGGNFNAKLGQYGVGMLDAGKAVKKALSTVPASANVPFPYLGMSGNGASIAVASGAATTTLNGDVYLDCAGFVNGSSVKEVELKIGTRRLYRGPPTVLRARAAHYTAGGGNAAQLTITAISASGTTAAETYSDVLVDADLVVEEPYHWVTDDPLLDQQFHHKRINLYHAWKHTKGGSAAKLLVVDTGLKSYEGDTRWSVHPDIPAPESSIDFGVGIDEYWDVTESHGTTVWSLIKERTGNGVGAAGIAPETWAAFASVSDPTGQNTWVSESDWAGIFTRATAAGIRIITNSVTFPAGGATNPSPVRSAIDAFIASGGLLFSAAPYGNYYFPAQNTCPQSPTDQTTVPGTIVVSATSANADTYDDPRGWVTANTPCAWGPGIEIVAPSGYPFGAYGYNQDYKAESGGYDLVWPAYNWGGYPTPDTTHHASTSFSTPQVAAVAALVWNANPDLSGARVRDILTSTADQGHHPDFATRYPNAGIVNAGKAVKKALSMRADRAGEVVPYLGFAGPNVVTTIANGAASTVLSGQVFVDVAAFSSDTVTGVELWFGDAKIYDGPPAVLPLVATSGGTGAAIRVVGRTASGSASEAYSDVYAATLGMVQDVPGSSDSTSSTDTNSVSVKSPAFASCADGTSSTDSTGCLLIVPTSVSTSFLLAASLLFAVLYDTATADTGTSAESVAISLSARQGDVTGEEDLAAIGLGVTVADSSSALDAASASVGRFSATTDATTSADSETDFLTLRSSSADASSQSDATGCELVFPETIDVSDTTASADGTRIVAAIGQADASSQSDIAYGYLGQFATGSDATTSTDGVGTSITTGVWVPPAKAPRIKLALGGPVIRLRSAAPEIDISHAGGPLIRLSLLEER